ncbi:hypothetical protein NQZ68_031083 [Dissostichus eleginoides]|nr:hypothetical protein NQZ68_031083 [Dissostichus eleginoides]
MHSGPYSAVPSKPQHPKHLPKPQQAGYKPKPHQPKPQQAANPSNPLQSWYRPKPQQTKPNQPSYLSNPQQAKPYQPAYPLNPQRATNPSSPLQSRYQPKPQHPAYPSNPQQAKPYQPSYPSNPQQAKPYQPAYPSNPQQPKPQQAKPLQGVLQTQVAAATGASAEQTSLTFLTSKTGELEGPEVDGFVKDMMALVKSVSFIRSLLTSLTLPPPDPLLQPSISGTDLDKFRKALMGHCDINGDGKIQKNELALCLGLKLS